MNNLFYTLRQKAKTDPRWIILPEGEEKRVQDAARLIVKEKIARIILFDKNGGLEGLFEKEIASGFLRIIEINKNSLFEKYAGLYAELRKKKGIDLGIARKIISENPVFLSALMVEEGEANGFVAGASLSTADVARAAIHCIKKKAESLVIGVFIMVVPDCIYGERGLFVFADCAIIPDPSSEELAKISLETADFTRKILGITPRIALLSYSTKGSSTGERIDRVRMALEIVKEKSPEILIDGEFQADTAIVPEVAKIKFPYSPIAGRANVLIFPNLEAGNCAYKLVHRLAKARAVGPILLGLGKPASDLSRGCAVEDIIDAVAVTVVRAQNQ
ncbi:MAG: phosphate acetyltransferase [Candidatus Omnitrophica bacterium]|nr:phosphate acetyltransferase [Candidatus Omnitrophota bacterium]MCM8797889.1 phosphate acetyltransferase [Candidatus Omnitrophota bacterium]